jgi:putative lipoprotein (rSAM/lipoprotein system)
MKMKFNALLTKFFGVMLALLGFASCDRVGIGLDMYGSPHADFKALGAVTDEAGKPVKGIRVAIRQHRHFSSVGLDRNDWYEDDTLFTDADGRYQLRREIPVVPEDVTVVFEDIDGEENGGPFQKTEAKPAVIQSKKGDNSWFKGSYEAKADVALKKQD